MSMIVIKSVINFIVYFFIHWNACDEKKRTFYGKKGRGKLECVFWIIVQVNALEFVYFSSTKEALNK